MLSQTDTDLSPPSQSLWAGGGDRQPVLGCNWSFCYGGVGRRGEAEDQEGHNPWAKEDFPKEGTTRGAGVSQVGEVGIHWRLRSKEHSRPAKVAQWLSIDL